MCLIGYAINISNAHNGAKYFGTFLCVGGSYGAFPGVVTWYGPSFVLGNGEVSGYHIYRLGNNLAGQYKRGIGMAVQIGIGNFSGAIVANIYLEKQAPRFRLGRTLKIPSLLVPDFTDM